MISPSIASEEVLEVIVEAYGAGRSCLSSPGLLFTHGSHIYLQGVNQMLIESCYAASEPSLFTPTTRR